MKHYLKNISTESLVFGSVTIQPNMLYMIYDDDIGLYGNYFKSFKQNLDFSQIHNLEYYQDDIHVNIQQFYDNWTIWENDTSVNEFSDTQNYRIYSLLNKDRAYLCKNPTILPSSLDYKKDVKKLHRKLIFKKGILVEAEYFENITITTNQFGLDEYSYDTPVLKVQYEYHIGVQSYVKFRYSRRFWAYCDGTYSTEYKEGPKYYTLAEAKEESIIRRTNVVNQTIMMVPGLLALTSELINTIVDAENVCIGLLYEIDENINRFVKGISDPLLNQLSTIDENDYLNGYDVANWMSNIVPDTGGATVRQVIISKLSEAQLTVDEIIAADNF